MGKADEGIGSYSIDPEASPNRSQDQLIVKPIKTCKGYIWDTWELPKDQRWLLFKLDAFVLTFASVSERSSLFQRSTCPDKNFLRSATSSRTSTCITSTMLFSAAWKRIYRCMETSLLLVLPSTPWDMSLDRYHLTCY
jgi:hypothetical protein